MLLLIRGGPSYAILARKENFQQILWATTKIQPMSKLTVTWFQSVVENIGSFRAKLLQPPIFIVSVENYRIYGTDDRSPFNCWWYDGCWSYSRTRNFDETSIIRVDGFDCLLFARSNLSLLFVDPEQWCRLFQSLDK